MLRDLLTWVSAPYPWHLAPMGYVREIEGIGRREEQCREAWGVHLAATRRAIADAAEAAPGRGTALVVGSGQLLDVPLEALTARFERVILADILQPRRIRRQLAGHPNVEAVALDVTGIAKPTYRYVRSGARGPLPEAQPTAFLDHPLDFAVSVNLLSQLTVVPANYLRAGVPNLPAASLLRFGRSIVTAHLDWLARLPGRVTLVTDIEREETGLDGVGRKRGILEGVALPPPDRAWGWDIAPRGTVYKDIAVRHRVGAWLDFKPAWARFQRTARERA